MRPLHHARVRCGSYRPGSCAQTGGADRPFSVTGSEGDRDVTEREAVAGLDRRPPDAPVVHGHAAEGREVLDGPAGRAVAKLGVWRRDRGSPPRAAPRSSRYRPPRHGPRECRGSDTPRANRRRRTSTTRRGRRPRPVQPRSLKEAYVVKRDGGRRRRVNALTTTARAEGDGGWKGGAPRARTWNLRFWRPPLCQLGASAPRMAERSARPLPSGRAVSIRTCVRKLKERRRSVALLASFVGPKR